MQMERHLRSFQLAKEELHGTRQKNNFVPQRWGQALALLLFLEANYYVFYAKYEAKKQGTTEARAFLQNRLHSSEVVPKLVSMLSISVLEDVCKMSLQTNIRNDHQDGTVSIISTCTRKFSCTYRRGRRNKNRSRT